MGKITGFMEFERLEESHLAPVERLKNYREFTLTLTQEQASQQGARCMDCGVPFCNNACPVNNIIPDWNDLVYQGRFREALERLHLTNNFPEITGRVCPAPCEAACVAGLITDPVGIKSIERFIIETGWENGWIMPERATIRTGKRVAIVGSGPAGLAAAQQLARAGHDVVVFEKNNGIGGLLRYGIPDFKLEKHVIDRRIAQMREEGVEFRTGVLVGRKFPERIANQSTETIAPRVLLRDFDAVILAGGAEQPREPDVPGSDLAGVHYAMEFLVAQNLKGPGKKGSSRISAAGKRVVVIGGGDTGSDCVGVSNRQGAASILQLDRMPRPPEVENKLLAWPYWPNKLRVSSSHEEGCDRDWQVLTKRIEGKRGRVEKLVACRVDVIDGRFVEQSGSAFEIPADLVLIAAGFASPVAQVLDDFGVEKDMRGNALALADASERSYRTSVEKVFAAGDMRRGQSLVVWAIREGRECAQAVDRYLMGEAAQLC
ncbi:glutamate synthase subunit beta [Oxalobacter vibrioformis]|uniref:Glutamate synthase subunit beta n=1 Tax=Oxalobacter vibrioformis TaxID=933080 RepID=A0A9E9M1L3_9BURK|nr:glutamate synthase subunit beta [Oxalobacter vibrioformis]WAW10838.1 glutamate synthase subunit beta [Oxalobacter vibrioformis]